MLHYRIYVVTLKISQFWEVQYSVSFFRFVCIPKGDYRVDRSTLLGTWLMSTFTSLRIHVNIILCFAVCYFSGKYPIYILHQLSINSLILPLVNAKIHLRNPSCIHSTNSLYTQPLTHTLMSLFVHPWMNSLFPLSVCSLINRSIHTSTKLAAVV